MLTISFAFALAYTLIGPSNSDDKSAGTDWYVQGLSDARRTRSRCLNRVDCLHSLTRVHWRPWNDRPYPVNMIANAMMDVKSNCHPAVELRCPRRTLLFHILVKVAFELVLINTAAAHLRRPRC